MQCINKQNTISLIHTTRSGNSHREVKNTNKLPKVVIRSRLFSKEIRHIPLYSFTAYTTIFIVAAVSVHISTVGPKISNSYILNKRSLRSMGAYLRALKV